MNDQESKKTKVFLCYAKEDLERVRDFYNNLKQAGLNPWLDEEDLLPGKEWKGAIYKAIKESDFFIVCLSNNTFKDGFLQAEIREALEIFKEKKYGDIYLIPVRLDDNCNVPENLIHIQWQDLFKENGFDRLLKSLGVLEEKIKRNNEKFLLDEIEKGNINAVISILKKNIDINCTDDSGNTPLMIAASKRYTEIVNILIQSEVDLNKINYNGHTALMLAAINGFADIIHTLIKAGAFNINWYDNYCHTALMLASMNEHFDATKILIDFEAQSNLRDNNGKTALWFARMGNHTEIVQLLEGIGAKE